MLDCCEHLSGSVDFVHFCFSFNCAVASGSVTTSCSFLSCCGGCCGCGAGGRGGCAGCRR